MLHACVYMIVCVCVSAVAERTTGAVGNIVAATGLGKKDEFPTDMNVRTLFRSRSAPHRFSVISVFLLSDKVFKCVHAHPQEISWPS